jgi:hypothetical protein
MLRRPHCCALIIGVALLLLALMLAVRVQLNHSRAYPGNTVRVAQAITRLEGGCLTCHHGVAESRLVVANEIAFPQFFGKAQVVVAPAGSLQTAVDTQLRDLGQRILALPASDEGPQADVVQAFAQVVDDTRTLAADAVPQVILGRIAAVETLLRHLENKASPYQVSRAGGPPVRLGSIPALATTLPLPVLHHHPVQKTVLDTGVVRSIADAHAYRMTVEVAYAVLRRGPPENSVAGIPDSVWSWRLLPRGMQSPFL